MIRNGPHGKVGVVAVAIVALLALGCEGATHRSPAPTAAPVAFVSYFTPIDTIVLPDTGIVPFVRIAGVDFLGDHMVIGETSEGMVALGAAAGGHFKVLAHRGPGPGELAALLPPKFDVNGNVHVLDPVKRRVAVYSSDGRLVHEGGFAAATTTAFAFQPSDDGSSLAVVGVMSGSPPSEVLLVIDSTGKIVRRIPLDIPKRPNGAPQSGLWSTVERMTLVRVADSVYVTRPFMDSVWIASLSTGSVRSIPVPIPGFTTAHLPADEPKGISDIRAWWATNYLITAQYRTSTGDMLLPYVKGVYFDGAPGYLMVRKSDGGWLSMSDAPPIVGVRGDTVTALISKGELPLVLVRFAKETSR